MVRRLGLLAVLALAGAVVSADYAAACHRHHCGRVRHHRYCGHHACCGYYGHCGHCGHAQACGGSCAAGACADPAPAAAWVTPVEDSGLAPATLTLTLPEGATLLVNGQVIMAQAGTQVFFTPSLEYGQDYYYVFQVRLNQNGQESLLTRVVPVQAGSATEVNLDPTTVLVSE